MVVQLLPFVSPAVADYIVHGVQKVRATIDDVSDEQVQQKLMKVNLYLYRIVLT